MFKERIFDRLGRLGTGARGARFARGYSGQAQPADAAAAANPLRDFFLAREAGPGIWKWDHYFDTYHRHLQGFRGRSPRVLEVGIYSGGSLDMWADYFGPGAQLYGVDIEPACKAYERPGVKVYIGDQQDRAFWKQFRAEVPSVDVVIDDGGHAPEQQIVTLEEMLPAIAPGGVYICEDVHQERNAFNEYVYGLSRQLSQAQMAQDHEDPARRSVTATVGLQAHIEYIALYPFQVVIQKRAAPLAELVAPKRGTQWQPFLR